MFVDDNDGDDNADDHNDADDDDDDDGTDVDNSMGVNSGGIWGWPFNLKLLFVDSQNNPFPTLQSYICRYICTDTIVNGHFLKSLT